MIQLGKAGNQKCAYPCEKTGQIMNRFTIRFNRYGKGQIRGQNMIHSFSI